MSLNLFTLSFTLSFSSQIFVNVEEAASVIVCACAVVVSNARPNVKRHVGLPQTPFLSLLVINNAELFVILSHVIYHENRSSLLTAVA